MNKKLLKTLLVFTLIFTMVMGSGFVAKADYYSGIKKNKTTYYAYDKTNKTQKQYGTVTYCENAAYYVNHGWTITSSTAKSSKKSVATVKNAKGTCELVIKMKKTGKTKITETYKLKKGSKKKTLKCSHKLVVQKYSSPFSSLKVNGVQKVKDREDLGKVTVSGNTLTITYKLKKNWKVMSEDGIPAIHIDCLNYENMDKTAKAAKTLYKNGKVTLSFDLADGKGFSLFVRAVNKKTKMEEVVYIPVIKNK